MSKQIYDKQTKLLESTEKLTLSKKENLDDSYEVYTEKEIEYLDKYKLLSENKMIDEELYDIIIKHNFNDESIKKEILEHVNFIKKKGEEYEWTEISKGKKTKTAPIISNNEYESKQNKNFKENKNKNKKYYKNTVEEERVDDEEEITKNSHNDYYHPYKNTYYKNYNNKYTNNYRGRGGHYNKNNYRGAYKGHNKKYVDYFAHKIDDGKENTENENDFIKEESNIEKPEITNKEKLENRISDEKQTKSLIVEKNLPNTNFENIQSKKEASPIKNITNISNIDTEIPTNIKNSINNILNDEPSTTSPVKNQPIKINKNKSDEKTNIKTHTENTLNNPYQMKMQRQQEHKFEPKKEESKIDEFEFITSKNNLTPQQNITNTKISQTNQTKTNTITQPKNIVQNKKFENINQNLYQQHPEPNQFNPQFMNPYVNPYGTPMLCYPQGYDPNQTQNPGQPMVFYMYPPNFYGMNPEDDKKKQGYPFYTNIQPQTNDPTNQNNFQYHPMTYYGQYPQNFGMGQGMGYDPNFQQSGFEQNKNKIDENNPNNNLFFSGYYNK